MASKQFRVKIGMQCLPADEDTRKQPHSKSMAPLSAAHLLGVWQ